MKHEFWKVMLFNISRFLSFFSVVCLVVTFSVLSFNRDLNLEIDLVVPNARRTFLCVLAMTFAGCGIDALRRHLTVERHLKRILGVLDRIGRGEFDQRVDVSDMGLASGGFREISEHINRLTQELSGVETLRKDFIANVSHEMKTPLAVVQNYASILQNPALPEETRREYTAAIGRTARRLADLVSNILKLNKLENQKIFTKIQTFDLGEQLAQCLLEYEPIWEKKDLQLSCELEDGVMVTADPELLQLVWSNLFSNAMKFTPAGGSVSVHMQADGPWASVCVSDTGCGMSQETGAHIFEKFYQGDTAHATEGNGLGLALVKRVVDITGGRIQVRSAPEEGSVFTVQIRRSGSETG